MTKRKKDRIRLVWSKLEKDWRFSYPDNAGHSLAGVFFDMVKTTGHRVDWRDDLKNMLANHGYDFQTLKITCDKISTPKTAQ